MQMLEVSSPGHYNSEEIEQQNKENITTENDDDETKYLKELHNF